MRLIGILVLICLAGLYDYMMDAIKDFKQSPKFWLKKWIDKHPEYLLWYTGFHPLPFIERKGIAYNPKYPWTSDAWHMMKHGLLLSWSGAVSIALSLYVGEIADLEWYVILGFTLTVWWFIYWIEGTIFNLGYQRLK